MELDELKQAWQHAPLKNKLNTDIMELIQHKTYGPVSALKKVFRKQIVVMLLIPFLLFSTNLNDVHGVLTSILFWAYVAFCAGIVAFAYRNYRIASRMEVMDGNVKENLEKQISLLEKRAGMELRGLVVVLFVFIALVEIVPYFQHYRMLDKWHSLPVLVRLGAYAALLALQHFLNKAIRQRKVGRHLDYLKALLTRMQEG